MPTPPKIAVTELPAPVVRVPMDLGRQFTRRHEDESSGESRPVATVPHGEALDHGQPERGRFARAGLGTRQEIGAPQDSGNGEGLDWRGCFVAKPRQR
jgi:hypothetical protein